MFPFKMVIFHSYVSLPEGKSIPPSGRKYLHSSHLRDWPGGLFSAGAEWNLFWRPGTSCPRACRNHYESMVARPRNFLEKRSILSKWLWINTHQNTIFNGMNIHLPAILMFTRGTRFWHTAKWFLQIEPHVHTSWFWRLKPRQISLSGHDKRRLASDLQWVPVHKPELGYWQLKCGDPGCGWGWIGGIRISLMPLT